MRNAMSLVVQNTRWKQQCRSDYTYTKGKEQYSEIELMREIEAVNIGETEKINIHGLLESKPGEPKDETQINRCQFKVRLLK